MSRPISEFPREVLHEIFKYIHGKDAVRCRAVCTSWLQAIDTLRDKAWKEYCFQDFEECFEAYKKANITWRDLYKCLTLWSKLPSATMKVNKIICSEMRQFCLVRDRFGVIKQSKHRTARQNRNFCDRIVYYDLETLTELSTTNFDFEFNTYSENDKFIVVIEVTGRLCIIPKATMERVFVGYVPDPRHEENEAYTLFEHSVYYKNADNFICMAKLDHVDGRLTVDHKQLCYFRDEIVTMTYVNVAHINILTSTGAVYCLKQKEVKLATMIFKYACNIPVNLKRYGFDWNRKSVYEWITSFFHGDVRIADKNGTFWGLGDVIVMGTGHRVIKIYYNPYTSSKLKLYHMKPTISVYLNKLFKFHVGYQRVHQIDAVEVPNGHKIIVFAVNKLIVLDFRHECGDKKRKAEENVTERRIKKKVK